MGWYRAFCFQLVCILVTVSAQAERPKAAQDKKAAAGSSRPNFLILLVDDLGYGDIGAFGNTTLPTPNIDRIGKEGARLTHSISASAICTPSRAALMTGRLPVRYGLAPRGEEWDVMLFLASKAGLKPNETTIPKLLGQHGYRRSLVGKWHLGLNCHTVGDNCHHPITHGFESYYGVPMTNIKDFGDAGESLFQSAYPSIFNAFYAVIIGGVMAAWFLRSRSKLLVYLCLLIAFFALFLAVFFSNQKILSSVLLRDFDVVEQPIRLRGITQRLVKETEIKLREYAAANKEKATPFFHMHSFIKMHTALAVIPEFEGQSQHGEYGDSMLELDWAVGRILDLLDELGMSQNTFVYFTSDNGGHKEETGPNGDVHGGWNGVLRGGKSMGGMEGGIRMPTFVKYPPRVKPGSVIDVPVSTMDVMPTVAKLAGLDLAKELPKRIIDGKDMMPVISKEKTESQHKFMFHYCRSTIHAARWNEDSKHIWKMHFYMPDFLPGTDRCKFVCLCHLSLKLEKPELYNLVEDISEQRPLDNNSDTYRRVLKNIRRAIAEHQDAMEDVPSELTWWGHIWRPSLQPCGKPPFCRCQDEKYPRGY